MLQRLRMELKRKLSSQLFGIFFKIMRRKKYFLIFNITFLIIKDEKNENKPTINSNHYFRIVCL